MKTYNIEFSQKAIKQMKKIDRTQLIRLKEWMKNNIVNCSNPYFQGKMLKGNLSKYWRYRVGNYRIVSHIDDENFVIKVVSIGHRRNIYNFEI